MRFSLSRFRLEVFQDSVLKEKEFGLRGLLGQVFAEGCSALCSCIIREETLRPFPGQVSDGHCRGDFLFFLLGARMTSASAQANRMEQRCDRRVSSAFPPEPFWDAPWLVSCWGGVGGVGRGFVQELMTSRFRDSEYAGRDASNVTSLGCYMFCYDGFPQRTYVWVARDIGTNVWVLQGPGHLAPKTSKLNSRPERLTRDERNRLDIIVLSFFSCSMACADCRAWTPIT